MTDHEKVIGMGCTPSQTTASANNECPDEDTLKDRRPLDDRTSEVKNGSGESVVLASNNNVESGQSSVQGGDKVITCPVVVAGADEDSESENVSFLCANLRRNFLAGRSGTRNGSSSGGAGKVILTTTAEEQNENFLSLEDGGDDSNPLLKRSANPPPTPGDIVVVSGTGTGVLTGGQQSILPHYMQLQQQQQQFHPFQYGRKLSSQVSEKVNEDLNSKNVVVYVELAARLQKDVRTRLK